MIRSITGKRLNFNPEHEMEIYFTVSSHKRAIVQAFFQAIRTSWNSVKKWIGKK